MSIALYADDPVLGEVVELVLVRHGLRVVHGNDTPLALHVDAEAIEIRRGGEIAGRLGRRFWEHELIAAVLAGPGRALDAALGR